MIFDTHAHYDDEQFCADLPQIINEMKAAYVGGIITCAVDFESCKKVIALADQYDFIYAAVGVYPHETHKNVWDRDKLACLASHKKVVCIGEIGLDYHYDGSPKHTQIEWVKNQIQLANELDMPISFHDREAHGDTIDIIRKYKPRGVLHCFSGSVEMARELIKCGMHIGIGGAVTFKNARIPCEVVADIPLEKLVLETDAPYMTPVPHRGKRNTSDKIIHIAEKIAELKSISIKTVLDVTESNAKEIFGIERTF
ncbi:MAG: TatD family hydrolase [Clostridia bacterium]|nr:TatD family hydrolase [Clostridia bacterium]MEE1023648.1 TatD family hydrolase [Acutalibacteraceae bacterium]